MSTGGKNQLLISIMMTTNANRERSALTQGSDPADRLSDVELDALCFEKFQTAVVSRFHSQWKATEIFGQSSDTNFLAILLR